MNSFVQIWTCLLCTAPAEVWTCELERRVNFLRSGREPLRRKKKNERERIGGVYYFCPVFSFTVPSPSVEKDPFPPLTMGVREATHKLVHVNVHSLRHTSALTHTHTRADVGKGHSTYAHSPSITYHSLLSWLCLFLFLEKCCSSLTTAIDFLERLLLFLFHTVWTFSKASNKCTFFCQILFCQWSIIPVQNTFNDEQKYAQKRNPLSLAFCYFASNPPPLEPFWPPPPPQPPLSASQDAMRETAERIRELEKALRDSMNTSSHREALWAQEEGARVQAQRQV